MPTSDFNGDGFDDLVLYRPFTGVADPGLIAIWPGGANANFALSDATAHDESSWTYPSATGDFTGDGFGDMFVTDVDMGFRFNWMGDAEGTFTAAYNGLIDFGWRVWGTGDFNGDGRDDMLWRNPAGTIEEWLGQANGGFVSRGAGSAAISVPLDWAISGVGDFNGDGLADVLWRNQDGRIGTWLSVEGGRFAVHEPSIVHVSLDWRIVGTGDFNGDGIADILWRHEGGQIGTWEGNEAGLFDVNHAAMVNVPRDWRVIGTGDFDGDGTDDILWRNLDGVVGTWQGTDDGTFTINPNLVHIPLEWVVQPYSVTGYEWEW